MPILNLEEMLKEMEEHCFAELPPDCTSGEEYEEWLRKDIPFQFSEGVVLIRKTKPSNINELSISKGKVIEP